MQSVERASLPEQVLGVSIPLYLNRRWTTPIWRACRARSGRDWMLNSGVLGIDAEQASPATHATCAAIFATYPGWLWLGVQRVLLPAGGGD